MMKYFGFTLSDLNSFSNITRLLNRPCDPSSLAVMRIFFGIVMILDIPDERGLSIADSRWGDPLKCRFPMFDSISPLPLKWMCMVYLLMLTGAFGIMIGAFYKLSCLLFLIPYWYLFLLDKTRWNNHSYLYGWLGFLLFLSDANKCWSFDGWWNLKHNHTHVPLWNYTLLRGQIFLVYFIAGLKKMDKDWVQGHSMPYLSTHWVFNVFKFVLTEDQIDKFIVHWGGFIFDLTIGFFLFFDQSRPLGLIFCLTFNLMNSQIFQIGMFPYMMIASIPIFYPCDWPKTFLDKMPQWFKYITLHKQLPNYNQNCIYAINEKTPKKCAKKKENFKIKFQHKIVTGGVCLFFLIQGFLPYSHWLTKGYNTWTQGLYGYSWDMMIHNWKFVHTKITVINRKTNDYLYIDPEAWTDSWRWPRHADMVKQFANCIQQRIHQLYNISDIEMYIDVWMSLNGRFTQRIYDPTVDILRADWSPFREVTWVLPLLTELSDWRNKLIETENHLFDQSEYLDVVFVADFPGFYLINYVEEDLGNTTLQILKGEVAVEFPNGNKVHLTESDILQMPVGEFHKVIPLKHSPVCYMYIYINTTQMQLDDEWKRSLIDRNFSKFHGINPQRKMEYFKQKEEQELKLSKSSSMNIYKNIMRNKYLMWKRRQEI
ncbi:vitamin K-dependent gamma-carboxylase-like [Centruroides sculpturatus]|uniref:vitamin K-dependent gamma-carboxylase-like n=1 Tax=Centruroides sculpturatus TaxID=218467 RepID=UPI000C6DF576|nr:vitamin K-dependent gamma-carboxylase-like [Centruroides sculpturatus]